MECFLSICLAMLLLWNQPSHWQHLDLASPENLRLTSVLSITTLHISHFGPGGLRAPCVRSSFSLFSFFFFSVFCFWPTSGNLPCVKICVPQYFGITRRYMQNKIFFLGNFYFLREKKLIFACYFTFYGQRSVTAAWATRSPWSISGCSSVCWTLTWTFSFLFILHFTSWHVYKLYFMVISPPAIY